MVSGLILGLSILASAVMAVKLQDIRSRELFANIRENYTINATSFQTLHADDIWECALMCLRASFCFYFNYQVSVERSALCRLILRMYVRQDQLNGFLVKTPGFVFGQITTLKGPNSCLDYMRMGETKNGVYEVLDQNLHPYNVFCDFTSEPSSAWTLVHSKLSTAMIKKGPPFYTNKPVNESNPNWNAYRLPFDKMQALRSVSTHWRITCSFPVSGVDYRDYVRAKFADVDMISYKGQGRCKAIEFINIHGYNCTNCIVPWWQDDRSIFHTDGSYWKFYCKIPNVPGSLVNEDSFGFYGAINDNFRCTSNPESTTNNWIGGYL